MDASEFGKRIQDTRCARGMTQVELAEVLSVSAQAVSKWETGGGFPDVATLPPLARALGVTTDYLFGSISKQQKVLVFNVEEGDGQVSNGREYRRKYEAVLNDKYLLEGWRIVSTQLSSNDDMTYLCAVIERDSL